jgi:hypothetical protein
MDIAKTGYMRFFGNNWVIDRESVRSINGIGWKLTEEAIQKMRETNDVSEIHLFMVLSDANMPYNSERPLYLVWYHIIEGEAVFHSAASLPYGPGPITNSINIGASTSDPVVIGNKLYDIQLRSYNPHIHGSSPPFRVISMDLENSYVWSIRMPRTQIAGVTSDGRAMLVEYHYVGMTGTIESYTETPLGCADELIALSDYSRPLFIAHVQNLTKLLIVARHIMAIKEAPALCCANYDYYVVVNGHELLAYSYDGSLRVQYMAKSPICCLKWSNFICEDGSIWEYYADGDGLLVGRLLVWCVPGPSKARSRKQPHYM